MLISFVFHVEAKVQFKGVPDNCKKFLQDLDKTEQLKNPVVDWLWLYKQMDRIGYPEKIAESKLKNMKDVNIYSLFESSILPQDGQPMTKEQIEYLLSQPKWFEVLPQLSVIKGVDVPIIVNVYLKRHLKGGQKLITDVTKVLTMFGPLWLQGEKKLENAKMFYLKINELVDVSWIWEVIPPEDRAAFAKTLRREAPGMFDFYKHGENEVPESHELYKLSLLPWDELPLKTRKAFEGIYNLDFKKYPPLKTDSIQNIPYGYQDAGHCSVMSNGHISCLNLTATEVVKKKKESWKDAVFLRVNGQIVGAIKFEGEPSMIALRNVMDSYGRVVMAMGGVYRVGKNFYINTRLAEPNAKGMRIADLERLQVRPKSFLLNDDAWEYVDLKKLIYLSGTDEKIEDQKDVSEEFKTEVRFGLVEKLDQTRKRIEKLNKN